MPTRDLLPGQLPGSSSEACPLIASGLVTFSLSVYHSVPAQSVSERSPAPAESRLELHPPFADRRQAVHGKSPYRFPSTPVPVAGTLLVAPGLFVAIPVPEYVHFPPDS